MTGIKSIDMQDRPAPCPEKGEALIRVRSVGVCGSDLHYFEHGKIGGYIVEPPFVLGHEAAGEVVGLGEGVDTLKIGDRVALEPGKTCGKCDFCREGKYNLCPDVEFFATPPFDGTLCEYVTHPAELCFKLPDSLSFDEGALVEPLAVGFHAALQAGARVGQTAVVLGSGCIGLCTVMALRSMGVGAVYATDVIPKRLDMAKKIGAEEAFDVSSEEGAAGLASLSGAFDLVFETAGSKSAALQTVELAKRGGTVVLVGLSPEPVMPFDIGGLIDKELTIKSVFRYRNIYPLAIKAIENGLPIKEIITDRFAFGDSEKALLYCSAKKSDVVKAVIEI